ncbi:hypothetical protein DB29_03950 [Shouchella clausii]|nr:hypothetical protein DB29_03950 [Shouchella clausii]
MLYHFIASPHIHLYSQDAPLTCTCFGIQAILFSVRQKNAILIVKHRRNGR